MKIAEFMETVSNSSAIRRVRRLQPINKTGSYVSPPTYLGNDKKPIHIFEKRRIDGKDTVCVLLDSVQSQANRFEIALSNALQAGELEIPNIGVDFSDHIDGIGTVSVLTAPHRIFDAIIRDSQLNKVDFPKTDIGVAVDKATPSNATELFHYSPTTLIFGGWNSSGDRGGNGPRFQRCVVSEIVGVNVPVKNEHDQAGNHHYTAEGKKPGSRIDPLEIEKVEIFKSKSSAKWSLGKFADSKNAKPSDVMHGNIPPIISEQGVTMDYAQQTTAITFAGLRRLSFPNEDNTVTHERNLAAWTTLAALSLCAVTQHDKNGFSLRSRCDLYPEEKSCFEIIENDGDIKKMQLTADGAKMLLVDSVKNAKKRGLRWETEFIKLTPQKKLVDLIKKSREPKAD